MKTLLCRRQTILKPADPVFHSGALKSFSQGLLTLTLHDESQLIRTIVRVFNDNFYLVAFQDLDVLGINCETYRPGVTKITERSNCSNQETLGLSGVDHEYRHKDGCKGRRWPEPTLGPARPHLRGRVNPANIPLRFLHQLLEKHL